MTGFLQDVRFGLRLLRKSPGFTTVAVLTLALGIGAGTTVFSVVDTVLLKALPYRDADRLVAVWVTEVGQPGSELFAPYSDFEEFKKSNHTFEAVSALTWARAGEILTWRNSPHQVLAIPTSPEFFSMLGIPAEIGRTFGPEDIERGCSVVLAHAFWQTELGAPKDIAGSTLVLSDKACTVAGVMPRGFDFYPKQTSLWTLITPGSKFSREPLDSVVGIFGRLKPGVSRASAERELAGLHQRVIQKAPAGNWVAHVVPIVRDLRQQFTWLAGRNLRTALVILSVAVALLVLIACLNVANLLLARASERQRELAVRAALGSGRSRLIRYLLTESALIAAVGSLLGVIIAALAVRYFNSANLIELPPGNDVSVNLRVLGFSIFLAAAAGMLCGLLPAWRVSRIDINEILKQSGRNSAGERHRTRYLLVIGQATLSMILLAGAGLTIESIVRLNAVPLGFRPDQILAAEVALPPAAYPKLSQRSSFYQQALARLSALPGVEAVALCSALAPYNGGASSQLTLSGQAPTETLDAVNQLQISSDYFRVVGIQMLRGRMFDDRDRETSQPVAIVNDQLVRRYFPHDDPIGRQIMLGKPGDKAPWLTIIGEASSEKRTTVYQEMGYVEPALVYLPVEQDANTTMGLVIRLAGKPLAMGPTLQREFSGIDPNVPVFDIKTMDERYAEFLAHPRFRAILMGILAGLTLLLAATGFYGLLAELVSQRTREIGIRMALGAQRTEVLGMVVSRGARLAIAGVCAGAAAGFLLTRTMASLLYGVGADDPWIFTSAGVVLIGVALLACYIPARRAAKVDPMVALRYE
ncbi:MAG TPA: ABC transporter permease [Candidatus Sulfotelmatobacter sp.]|nr:ABC transporter permease [Candidatus Sulfotelmatobacter sp.]